MLANFALRSSVLTAVLAVSAAGQNVAGNSNPSGFVGQTGWGYSYSVFAANDQSSGTELWVLPYLASTTCPPNQAACLIDIRPGPNGSEPRDFVPLAGNYLFVANDGTNGVELWRTNGTSAGTMMIADINPTGSSNPHELTVVGNRVFFSAIDDAGDRELYVSDGMSASRVADIWPMGSSNPKALFAFGNELLFTAEDGTHGRELWHSDGMGTTALVLDINSGPDSSGATEMSAVNGRVVFAAYTAGSGTELWSTDGSPGGTKLLKEIEPGAIGSQPGGFQGQATLFFAATTSMYGRELWKTDGTTAGTVMVSDLRPGPLGSDPRDIENYLFDVWFVAEDGIAGREVWRTDTVGSAPVRITDIVAGPGSISPRNLVATPQPNSVVFTDESESHRLWVTSTAPGGAAELATFRNGPGNLIQNLSVTGILSGAPVVFTAADNTNGLELWRTDGTALGTSMIADIAPPGTNPVPPELELETLPDGTGVELRIAGGPMSGLALMALANAPMPAVPLPGLVTGTVNLVAPIATALIGLDATGMGRMPIPIPDNQASFLFASQAFTLGSSGLPFTSTDNGSLALETSHPTIPCGGSVRAVGTFVDKDHRYEVSVGVSSTLVGGHFQFRHALTNGEVLELKDHRYENTGAPLFFFSGHTPLHNIDRLELLYVCPNGTETVIWRSYC